MPCMQICYHKSPSFQPDEEGPEFVEIDFDFASPLGGDLASLLAHAWEVVWNFLSGSLTPQAKIERMLQKRFSQVLR